MGQDASRRAWLIFHAGAQTGSRYPVRDGVTRIGRASDNDIVVQGKDAEFVSSKHCEIRSKGAGFRLVDLESTNGTFMNGERIADADLQAGCLIVLGARGPQMLFELESQASREEDRTLALPAAAAVAAGSVPAQKSRSGEAAGASIEPEHEELLSNAVRRARKARLSGDGEQTAILMREVLSKVIHSSGRRSRWIIGLLSVTLLGVVAYSIWQIRALQREQMDIDDQILSIEARLSAGIEDSREVDQLIDTLSQYQTRARALQSSMFYQLGVRNEEHDFVEEEIRRLLAEFGAEAYSIPPEFVVQVNRFIHQYQERDRPNMERAMGRARGDLEAVRASFAEQNLPRDLAYMVLVESAFIAGSASPAGAAGLWQFTAETARAYGLRVDETVDERLDARKSTGAAGRYIRELILDFGTGSSVMLALAAYNLGPGNVKRAVRKVDDPIKERNFWYLYRVRALPQETREYVPKIIAAMIIGRNPQRFGFG